MAEHYGKIFDDIHGSSVSDDVEATPEQIAAVREGFERAARQGRIPGAIIRAVFIAQIIKSDDAGRLDMRNADFAAAAKLPPEWVQVAVHFLSAPDTSSRSADNGGRRIWPLYGNRREGWTVLNKPFYRGLANPGHLRTRGLSEGGQDTNSNRDSKSDREREDLEGRPDFVRPPDSVQQSLHGMTPEAMARTFAQRSEGLFQERWGIYPRKEKRARALRYWRKSVRTSQDLARFDMALARYVTSGYAAEIQRRKGESFVMMGATFFGCWEDYVEFKPPDLRPAKEAAEARELSVGAHQSVPEETSDQVMARQRAEYARARPAAEAFIMRHGRLDDPAPRATGPNGWTAEDYQRQRVWVDKRNAFQEATGGVSWTEWCLLEEAAAPTD